jgi:hypothetical protein
MFWIDFAAITNWLQWTVNGQNRLSNAAVHFVHLTIAELTDCHETVPQGLKPG